MPECGLQTLRWAHLMTTFGPGADCPVFGLKEGNADLRSQSFLGRFRQFHSRLLGSTISLGPQIVPLARLKIDRERQPNREPTG